MKTETKQLIGKILRWIAEILLALAAALGVTTLVTSCGSLTKAAIRQVNPNSTVQVTITTNNPSTIDVTPNVQLKDK